MMAWRASAQIAAAFFALVVLSGCAELGDFVELEVFEESQDPELRGLANILPEVANDKAAYAEFEQSLASEGPSHLVAKDGDSYLPTPHLDSALALNPDNPAVLAAAVAAAELRGENSEEAIAALTEALARQRAAHPRHADTAEGLREEVLFNVALAQRRVYEGKVDPVDFVRTAPEPPDPESDPAASQLYLQYCATVEQMHISVEEGPSEDSFPRLFRIPVKC